MVLPVTGVPTLSAPATHCSPDLGEAPSEKAAPLPISPLLIVMGWTVSPQREMLRSLLQEQKMWPHSEIGSWQTQLRWDRSDRSWFSKPGVSITKGKYGYKPKGEMPCEDEGGGQGDAAEAVEHQRWSADYLKLGGEAWNGFSFTAHKRGPPCWHTLTWDFQPLWLWKWRSLSRVQLFVTPWTIQSVEFSWPKYWSG